MNKGTTIVGFLLSFVAGAMIMWGIDRGSNGTASATKDASASSSVEGPRKVNPGAVKVELYVMSQCPYGVQAENAFKDVVEKFGADVDFRVEFIGSATPTGEFSSLHGAKEVAGDLFQACAQKYTAKWFDLILCQNKNSREVDTNGDACGKELNVATDKITACATGQEGKDLLTASFKKATDVGARGSPTILIAGNKYEGGRKPADFMRAICGGYTGKKPASCSDIPESPKVNVTLLGDKRCEECDTKRLEGQVRNAVASPVLKSLDYGSEEGKKLYDLIKPAKLPVVVFDKTLDADKDATAAFARGIKPAGDLKVLSAGEWNPVCADTDGCKLDECKSTLACRAEEPNKLEVFVMSHCPFGVKGLDAMEEVLANFKKADAKIDFVVHYIGDGDAKSGLKSMHGPDEVAEDIREVCAVEHYGKDLKFMDYIWCRDKAIKDNNWEACTGAKTGFDTEVMKKCSEGDEGKGLLEKSFAGSVAAGMQASPTWLVNGKFKFSGIDAETIKTNVCAHNKLAGCDVKLTGQAPRPAGNGAAAPAQPGCGG